MGVPIPRLLHESSNNGVVGGDTRQRRIDRHVDQLLRTSSIGREDATALAEHTEKMREWYKPGPDELRVGLLCSKCRAGLGWLIGSRDGRLRAVAGRNGLPYGTQRFPFQVGSPKRITAKPGRVQYRVISRAAKSLAWEDRTSRWKCGTPHCRGDYMAQQEHIATAFRAATHAGRAELELGRDLG